MPIRLTVVGRWSALQMSDPTLVGSTDGGGNVLWIPWVCCPAIARCSMAETPNQMVSPRFVPSPGIELMQRAEIVHQIRFAQKLSFFAENSLKKIAHKCPINDFLTPPKVIVWSIAAIASRAVCLRKNGSEPKRQNIYVVSDPAALGYARFRDEWQ